MGHRAGVLGLLCLLAGCYEAPTEVTLYEPGVYKGASDPLLEQVRDPEHQQRLRKRLAQGQRDR